MSRARKMLIVLLLIVGVGYPLVTCIASRTRWKELDERVEQTRRELDDEKVERGALGSARIPAGTRGPDADERRGPLPAHGAARWTLEGPSRGPGLRAPGSRPAASHRAGSRIRIPASRRSPASCPWRTMEDSPPYVP